MDELFKQVERARSGDEEALSSILEQFRTVFHGFFLRRLGARTEVDDLVQNTLMRVHRGLSDLKDPSKIRAFAMKAAFFELNDFYRGRYSIRETLIDSLPEQEESSAEARLISSLDIQKALGALSPRARKILELREIGYRYEEIADQIGTTEAAVKMQVKRAFEKLRDLLPLILILLKW